MKLSPGHHSLPRKKTPMDKTMSTTSQIFQRSHPTRRSCLSPQYHHQHHHPHRQQESSLHFEYFVPRSVSEFNLAATVVTDIAVAPLPPAASTLRPSSIITPPSSGLTTNAPATNQGRLLDASSSTTRSREKMVTFEDEGINCGGSASNRKNVSSIDNIFM